MQNRTNTIPLVDSNKVENIRAMLDNNLYVVNTKQVADKMLALELALPQKL